MQPEPTSITVEILQAALAGYPPETELMFQGGLTFFRVNERGDGLVQVEFNETPSHVDGFR